MSAIQVETTRGAYDNSIRLPSALLLLVSLVGLVGCSSTMGPVPSDASDPVPSDAQVSCDAAGCDAGESRVDATGVQITCGTVTCAASDSYCVVNTGGAGGQGGGGQTAGGLYTTFRCVPFPSGCSSHSCSCALDCHPCTQNGAGAVTVMCQSV